jgi:hypothetical protein
MIEWTLFLRSLDQQVMSQVKTLVPGEANVFDEYILQDIVSEMETERVGCKSHLNTLICICVSSIRVFFFRPYFRVLVSREKKNLNFIY